MERGTNEEKNEKTNFQHCYDSALLLPVLNITSLTASADGNVHKHCSCGRAECTGTENCTMTEYTALCGEVDGATLEVGGYYLSGDVTLTSPICNNSGGYAFCLNGHKMSIETEEENAILAKDLYICDCSAGHTGELNISVSNTESDRCFGIYSSKVLTIYSGKVTVAVTAEQGKESYGVFSGEEILIEGANASVTAEAGSAGLYAYSSIAISGGEVNASAINVYGHGIHSEEGSITIEGENTSVTAVGSEAGLYTENDLIVISGGTVNASGTQESGVGICADDDINISGTNTSVTAEGTLLGIKSFSSIAISGGEVNASSTSNGVGIMSVETISISGINTSVISEGFLYGVYSKESITISGGTVTTEGSEAAIYTEDGGSIDLSSYEDCAVEAGVDEASAAEVDATQEEWWSTYKYVKIGLAGPVQPRAIEGATIVLDGTDNRYVYSGAAITPVIQTIDGKAVTKDTDYTVSGDISKTAIGTYTLTVTGVGKYSGTTTVTWKIVDPNPPTGSIKIGNDTWTEFETGVEFNRYKNTAQTVIITGEDAVGESGLDQIYYYISETDLTADEVKELQDSSWTNLTVDANGSGTITIQPDKEFVIYVKITDRSGNVTYLSSGGFVLDSTAPVITGVTDGKGHCGTTIFKVTDANLKFVTLDGDEINLDENDSYQLTTKVSAQVIKAIDRAGNETTVTVTVYDDHDYGNWITDKEATETAEGKRHQECSHCGQKKIEYIPMIGGTDSGDVTKGVVVNPGAPEATLNNTKDALVGSNIFTDTEKESIENGFAHAIIWLEIDDLEEEDAQTMALIKAKAKEVAGENAPINLLDISLFKQLTGDEARRITEPGINISVSIKIPEALINTDSNKIRTYYILRVHGGICEKIGEGTADANGEITVTTDKFSTYAIVYKDTNKYTPAPAPAPVAPAAVTATSPKTGDSANLLGWMIVLILGFVAMAGISVVYYRRQKQR